jgi:hypothetical protein
MVDSDGNGRQEQVDGNLAIVISGPPVDPVDRFFGSQQRRQPDFSPFPRRP